MNRTRSSGLVRIHRTNLFPCSMAMAASFDRELIAEIGDAIAVQAHAKQIHCLYGPTVNIARSPLSGRGYEFSGEDPHLSGELAAVWINHVQAGGVIACIKHFVSLVRQKGVLSKG